jgi:glycosyltransferase involved in cell wall biosynthesis
MPETSGSRFMAKTPPVRSLDCCAGGGTDEDRTLGPGRPMLRVVYFEVSGRPIRDSYVQLIDGWTKRQVSVSYVFYEPRASKITAAPGCEAAFHPTYSRSKLTFPQDGVRLATELHRQKPFQLVVADDPMGSGLAGCWLKQRLHLPLLVKVHTQYFGHLQWVLEKPYYPLYYLMAPFILAQADRVQAISQSVRRSLLPLGVAPGKIEVCPTPIRTHLIESSPRKQRRSSGQRLLNVGYQCRQKGLEILLQAVARLVGSGHHPNLTLVGDGPARPALELLADRLGIRARVNFVGYVPQSSLTSFYRDCDVFVLPTRYEGLGRVLVEAALAGAPIVTTAIGPTAEAVLPGETALLVPPNDPEALAAAIGTLLDQPQRARSMGARGQQFARKHFEYEKMMDDVAALWHRASGKKSGPCP